MNANLNAPTTEQTALTSFGEPWPDRVADADPIATEIVRHGLNAAAEQMKRSIIRTAFSPIIYEALDFAVALYDDDYGLLAQAPTLPAFMGTLGACVREAVHAVGGPDALRRGDVVLYNDPYGTGSHPQDAAMVVPVFVTEPASAPDAAVRDVLVGFAAIKAHWLDIGGKDPYCTDTIDVFQEGTIFPGVKLYDAGSIVDPIYRMVLANSRMPQAVIGDINAMVAGTRAGGTALAALVERFGVTGFRASVARMYRHADTLVRAWIESVPDGVYEASGTIDTDGVTDRPVPLTVRLEISGSTLRVDLTGAPDQTAGPINCPLPSTVAYGRLALTFLAGVQHPNEGHFRALELLTRRGSLMHPVSPAPCFMYGIPADHCLDLILEAIHEAVPGTTPAGSGGDINALVWWGDRTETGQAWADGAPHPVGQGASVHADGGNALMFHSESATRFTSSEVWESRNPWMIEHAALAVDSGGPGRHRGGLGLDLTFRVVEDCFLTSALARTTTRPRGFAGGGTGRPNGLEVVTPDGQSHRHAMTTRIPLPAGARVHLRTGSGGGYGPAADRAVVDVLTDLREGYITLEHARRYYPHAVAIVDAAGEAGS